MAKKSTDNQEAVEVMENQETFADVVQEVVIEGAKDVNNMMEEIKAAAIAAAKEEAAKIIAAAKEEAAAMGEAKADTQAAVAPKNDPYYEELVPVMLFKDNEKYKEDVFVSVNGETCLIQRGKQVNIKRKFYEVLMQSQAQDMATAEMIAGYTNEYKDKEAKLN